MDSKSLFASLLFLQVCLGALATQQQTLADHATAEKCKPMLNWPLLASDSSHPANRSSSFDFSIADIDLPVNGATQGTISSAMSFMSALSSQFDPLAANEEPNRVDNIVRFRQNRMLVSGLNLSMLSAHLHNESDARFAIGISIKNTTLTGRFSYNGPLTLTESQLEGFYRLSIDNVYLVASSNLTRANYTIDDAVEDDNEEQPLERFVMRTEELRMNVSNLGYISIEILDSLESQKPTSNYLLRMFQRLMQKTAKRVYHAFESHISAAMERESRRQIDCELTRFRPLLARNSSQHQSDLARLISAEIVRSRLNKVQLPPFEHQQSVFGSSASISFFNGSLSGLERLELNGETRLKLQDEHLLVNSSIGWTELKPYYDWSLRLGNAKSNMSTGFVAFNIKRIDFDAVIVKGLKPHTRFVVDQLTIRRLDSPKMDIRGLPGMNRVTRAMVNFFMGRLKQRLASSIQPVLKSQLERLLNKISSFV